MPETVVAPVTASNFASFYSQPSPEGGTVPIKADSAHHASYIADVYASQVRISQIGEQPATIVNLNPYPLAVLGALFSGIHVQPNREGERYFAYVIKRVKYEVDTGLDHNHKPVEFWPIQLALEFERQYAEKGGVFIIKGDLEAHPELENTAEFKMKYKAAEEQLVEYAFRQKRSADNEWNSPNHQNARNIHAVHRIAATLLYKRRLIAKLPDWMSDERIDVDSLPNACVTCGAEPKKGALVCGVCGMILDPFAAYQKGVVDENHQCLERLTRAQVEQLGISAYVAETSDERPKRIAAGTRKPLSQFELKAMAAQEKEQAAAAKTAKAEKEAK